MTINNLYVTYDEYGEAHYFINDDEVFKDVWLQQHPHLKRGQGNGGNSDGGRFGRSERSIGTSGDTKEQVREGVRGLRAKAKAQRAGGAPDELGQPEE